MNSIGTSIYKNLNPSLLPTLSRADLDANQLLDIQEVARFINARVREHIQSAIRSNPPNFARVDVAPRDGLVSWDEYHAHFLREKGVPAAFIEAHTEGNHVPLDRSAKGMDFHQNCPHL